MMRFKNMLKLFSKTEVQEDKTHPTPPLEREGALGIRNDGESVIQRVKPEESQNQELLRSAQDDERFSLAPMRVREELLCEQSELSNSGEGCKDLPSPDATRHPFPREGNKVSCAKHNEKHLSSNRLTILTILKHKLDCFAYARNDDLCAEHTEKDLSSNRPIVLTTSKKVAFTLAEVLITLGIIGVVAALTLPTLIANHKKQTYVNQLKKVVNTLENAAQLAVAQEGVSSFKDTSLYCKLFDAYNCSNAQTDTVRNQVMPDVLHYFKLASYKIGSFDCTINYKKLNGSSFANAELYYKSGIKLIFPDGVIVYLQGASYFEDYIDVNGDKGPNILGRDLFIFSISDSGKFTEAYNDSFCANKSEAQYLDNECFYKKIVSDGWKMNY